MPVIFDENRARTYDQWLQTPTGLYIDAREKNLILDLVSPRAGERLLDVGCGTGDHLFLYHTKGCHVTGIDPSPYMLDIARQKLGASADLHLGSAEDLPFSDNEFDVVTLMTSLEFTADPQTALSEAIRVCRGRVFLGVLNKYSLIAIQRRIAGLSRVSIYSHARFYSIFELTQMIRRQLRGARIRWGSVIFFPVGWYAFSTAIEESLPVMKNPFGAFLGLSFPVTFSYRTIQDPVRMPFQMEPKGQMPVQGAIRVIK
jgi:ubiquinone/menaquinone biosynthesis C-methylase UbiE